MHSQQVVEFGQPLEGREGPAPEPKGSEVLIKIEACGVCHSDLHIWDGYFDLGGGARIELAGRGIELPFTMGHEIVGEVAALGPDAEGVEVGDKRIVFPWVGCGECAVCKAGEEQYCNAPLTLGSRYDGGFAEMVIAPHARYLIPYDGVPKELACTYACSGLTAYSALKKLSHLGEDDFVLIIGAGGVGLSAVHLAASVIEAKVIVADIDEEKRAVARQSGAFETLDNGAADVASQLRNLTGGGAAGVIDFVGAPGTANLGFHGLRKGGIYICVGLFGDALSLPLPTLPLTMRTMMGSYVGTLEEMHELMALVRDGKVPPIPYEVRPLQEANAALEDLRAGKVIGRVVLAP